MQTCRDHSLRHILQEECDCGAARDAVLTSHFCQRISTSFSVFHLPRQLLDDPVEEVARYDERHIYFEKPSNSFGTCLLYLLMLLL